MAATDQSKSTVLVVDDEPAMRDAIGYNLRREGYEVDLVANGPAAIAHARATNPQLIILDIMLPGMDGLQVCRVLRGESTVPILFLSAKTEEVDLILGLEIGGDDYLTKPFAMRELIARVKAMIRRSQMGDATNDITPRRPMLANEAMQFNDLTIDSGRRRVTLGERTISLKPKEFDLLAYLARHAGLVMSREALLREVWGYEIPFGTRTVDVHVRWLRQKLETDPSHPLRIETVRGYGYRFVGDAP